MKGVADLYPLTPAQLGILADHLGDNDPQLYFEQLRCDLVGDVDVEALRAAWELTVAHHPALRTIWLWDGLDTPLQVVREHVDAAWTALDWRDHTDPRTQLDELARRDRLAGFDLGRPPVWRITVVRLDDRTIHLVWSFHHIMLDGWSADLVLGEMLDRYAGRTVPVARPFRDHVAWIDRQDVGTALSHWGQLLNGFNDPTRLAIGSRSEPGVFRRGRTTIELGEQPSEQLAEVARAHRVTMNTLVQSAWATVLSCYSGDADVVFGVTSSGRPAELDGVERMVGMFLSTLPMRVRFDQDRTVAQLWDDVQRQQLDLIQYQYSSLADILRQSDVPAGAPLFETALIFENFPITSEEGRTLAIERRSVFEQTRFSLTLMIGQGDQLEIVALYDGSRFDGLTVDHLLDRFLSVLVTMADEPGRPARSISVLRPDERHRMLVEWNRTDRPRSDTTVHDEIERHARERPDALALIDGDLHWSYRDLVVTARRLSARLLDAGAAPGRAVLVALPRSADAIAAMLAVIRLGAAYVALEPTTRPDRTSTIIDEADPVLVVTNSSHRGELPEHGVPVLELDADAAEADDSGTTAPDVAADDPLYVIFTSGSTGRPKGVPGSHRAVLNRLQWEREVEPYTDGEIACQKTTFAFVDHVAELWGPLVAGAPVVIVPDDVVRDTEAFVDLLGRHRIRRIVLVPSLLELILDSVADLATRLPHLISWKVSGETLDADLARRFVRVMPHARLTNVYGMSEVMADATCFDGEVPHDATNVPIGRPIHNQRVYVLDGVGRPTPVGVPGQIWISGTGLASGYWRRPDLTAERFAPNPFGEDVHGRWYSTGDLGRWLPDGHLEFLGRLDRQVKIRGVRVELGDVEASLRRLDEVRDAVVIDTAPNGRCPRLEGYVVADEEVDPADLRRRLAALVPEAFVPAVLHRVGAVPLLPSGKPDRRALAESHQPPVAVATHDVPDELRAMTETWQHVLEVDIVGPDDDFFDIGGHSVAAIRLMSRIRRDTGANLSLATLYSHPTPRQLLALIERRADDAPGGFRHLVPITRGADDRRRLYCVHGAGGNVLNLRDLGRALGPAWSLIGVQASGVDGVTPPHTSIDAMSEAYIAEILADRGPGPLFVAGFSGGGIVAYDIGLRLAARGTDADAIVLLDTFHPSIRGRRRTPGEHVRALRRQGPGYLLERVRVRRERHLYGRADELLDRSTGDDGVVPHELRDVHLVANIRSLIDRYEPAQYGGLVHLFAASDVLDVYEHAGPDRGWRACARRLEVDLVPGGHQDLVLDPHANELASRLRDRLEPLVEATADRGAVR